MPNKDVPRRSLAPFAWLNTLVNTIFINYLQQSQLFRLKFTFGHCKSQIIHLVF